LNATSPPRPLDLGWMPYLAPDLAARISPQTGVMVEHDPDGGILMIAADTTFDVRNAAHLAASAAIRDATTPLVPLT
jgi:Immunity protein 52